MNFEHDWKVSSLCMNECFAPCHVAPFLCKNSKEINIVQIQFWYIHMNFEYIWKVSPLCMNECFTACFCKLQSRDKCRLFTHTVHAGIYVRTLSPKGKLSAVCSAKKVEMEPVFDLPFSPPSTAAAAVLSSSSQHCTAHWVSCQATSVLPCQAIFCHILPFGSHGD